MFLWLMAKGHEVDYKLSSPPKLIAEATHQATNRTWNLLIISGRSICEL